MSKGFVGHMRLTSDDGEFFICRYGCCNLNIESHKELYYHDESGEIHIARCALYEGNDHFEEYLTTGKIQVKNAQGTWNTRQRTYKHPNDYHHFVVHSCE